MGNNPEGRNKGGVSALFVEGVQHVQRQVEGARGEQAIGIAEQMLKGLKRATRPIDYQDGIRAACAVVEREARAQLLSYEKQKVH
jgi:hypothetical protein